ncbi:hypothetical protein E1A91_D11G266200v1 [Gossypium mustelinum]|uniref:Uncharacterized protein n=1 Tax=Gossypium mustelinum TaxID=34275 RepID=A0A5D2SX30_GOSMU|nr:hypothetical protein E1A91_D11G266200v1 [Gossypium mustelinum]
MWSVPSFSNPFRHLSLPVSQHEDIKIATTPTGDNVTTERFPTSQRRDIMKRSFPTHDDTIQDVETWRCVPT